MVRAANCYGRTAIAVLPERPDFRRAYLANAVSGLGDSFQFVAVMGGWSSPPREPRWPRPRARALAAELLATGRLETAGFVTHRFSFDEAGEAYELIDRSPAEVLRATITYD